MSGSVQHQAQCSPILGWRFFGGYHSVNDFRGVREDDFGSGILYRLERGMLKSRKTRSEAAAVVMHRQSSVVGMERKGKERFGLSPYTYTLCM